MKGGRENEIERERERESAAILIGGCVLYTAAATDCVAGAAS